MSVLKKAAKYGGAAALGAGALHLLHKAKEGEAGEPGEALRKLQREAGEDVERSHLGRSTLAHGQHFKSQYQSALEKSPGGLKGQASDDMFQRARNLAAQRAKVREEKTRRSSRLERAWREGRRAGAAGNQESTASAIGREARAAHQRGVAAMQGPRTDRLTDEGTGTIARAGRYFGGASARGGR